jgi:hypothetical protein
VLPCANIPIVDEAAESAWPGTRPVQPLVGGDPEEPAAACYCTCACSWHWRRCEWERQFWNQ